MMSDSNRAVALLLILLFFTGLASPASLGDDSVLVQPAAATKNLTVAATSLVVQNTTFNYLQAFDDDDFLFRVYNYTFQVAGANVTLSFAGNSSKYQSKITFGDGTAVFYNVPQGAYQWRVTWAGATKTGTLLSDGPDAFATVQVGNLEADNDDDDLKATVLDIDGNPAQGLNFSIHFLGNGSVYQQVVIGSTGQVSFYDIPTGSYRWKVTVMTGSYAGTILAQGTFLSDGTLLLVHQTIGPFTGSPDYYDLEVFTYYETTIAPIVGALVNVTYKNGTVIGVKVTPANGTVLFVDLPVAFVNWTVSFNGTPVGSGDYYRDLTTASTDVRDPVVGGPGDQEFLVGTSNITITWQVFDEHPKTLQAFVDDVSKKTVTWTNQTSFFLNVTGYALGRYTVKLVATDTNLNTAEDIIKLRIYENVTPVISGPADVTFYYTETGYSLRWNVTDDNLDHYSITRNGELVANGSLSQSQPFAQVSLEGLGIGAYVYLLTANDTSGNEASDSVTVTVKADDVAPVFVFEPTDVYYYRGDLNVVRNWTVTDDFKQNYTIAVNGFVVVEDVWTSDSISFTFSGLSEGVHYVVLTVRDLGNNTASSTVVVTVFQSQISLLIGIVGGLAGLTLAVILVVLYIRRR